jgi:hypothetical protein
MGMGGHRSLLMVMVWVWVQIQRKMLGFVGEVCSFGFNEHTLPKLYYSNQHIHPPLYSGRCHESQNTITLA